MQRLLATTKANFLKSYLQSYELQLIKDSATINSWGQTFLNQNLYLSENQPCLSQSYILQPVKDLSEQNSSKFHKKWRGGQSLSVLLFYLNRNCVYLKITTSGRHVFRRMFFLDPIFCSRDWNDTQKSVSKENISSLVNFIKEKH